MFNTYMGMLVWPMIALGWVVNLMQRGTRVARAHQRDHARSSPPSPRRRDAGASWARCAARSSFATCRSIYGSGAALNGVNLRIPAGTTVAIVGHTG